MADEFDEETTAHGLDEPSSAASRRNQATVTVLTGSASGQMHKITGNMLIGRAPNAEIRCDDDGVSRNHARLHAEGDTAWVDDLGSRNGTFVNGERIQRPTELGDGDKLQVGRSTVLRFAFQDALDESFHENLLSSALRDGLTKLFNRRYLMDRLDSELKFAQRHETSVSLLMIDVDHFKRINDTRGHLAGDAVLGQFAQVLLRAVRNEDVVARFGGEEFAIILRAIGIDPAAAMAERLRRTIEQCIVKHHSGELRGTVSIGVAGFPSTPAKMPDDLVHAADQALYRAKHAGRNRVAR